MWAQQHNTSIIQYSIILKILRILSIFFSKLISSAVFPARKIKGVLIICPQVISPVLQLIGEVNMIFYKDEKYFVKS